MRLRIFASFALLAWLTQGSARADLVTAGFEGLPSRHSSSFSDAGFTFSNTYTADGDYFTGFAVSNEVNNVPINSPKTSDDYYQKQFGAYAPAGPGTGSGGSSTYAIAYNYFVGDAVITLPTGIGAQPYSIDVANTTYVASSLLYGDQFASPIARGQYFKLDIYGLDAQGNPIAASPLVVTLADDPDGQAHVVYGFTRVDLTSLQGAQALGFNIDTNVNNSSGFATVPFTFAVDNVVVSTAAVPEPSALALLAAGLSGLGWKVRRQRSA